VAVKKSSKEKSAKPGKAARPARQARPAPAAKPAKSAKSAQLAKPAKSAKPATSPPAETLDLKSIYQGFVDDLLNGGRYETAERYLDSVVTSHNPFPDQQPGREGFVAALRAFREAFPDLRAVATHLVAEGNLVVGRFEVTGTHRGQFMGSPATGNAIHYEEIAIVRFAGEKIVEHWSVADALAIMQQLQASE
jgi:predicted ester cyclase